VSLTLLNIGSLRESLPACGVVHVQDLVQKSVDETEKAVHMVNELEMFATNEDVEEIATNDLRFLLKLFFSM